MSTSRVNTVWPGAICDAAAQKESSLLDTSSILQTHNKHKTEQTKSKHNYAREMNKYKNIQTQKHKHKRNPPSLLDSSSIKQKNIAKGTTDLRVEFIFPK